MGHRKGRKSIKTTKRGTNSAPCLKFHYDIEVDLHGMFAEEALSRLENIVFSNEGAGIMVIHGKGNGILREKARNWIKNCKRIKSVRYGEEANIPGLDGVTVIYT
jgi:dsDNA-specific endonuclease/ATPase MutS2